MSWRKIGDRLIWRARWADDEAPSAGPFVIGDTMDPVQSMADGKIYHSKAAIRRSYRADGNPQGVEYVEVGNDPARLRPPPPRKPDYEGIDRSIERAIARLESRGSYD